MECCTKYKNFADQYNIPCRIIFVDEDIHKILNQNHNIPKEAIYKLNKELESPTTEEGCEIIIKSSSDEGILSTSKAIEFIPMLMENLDDYPNLNINGWLASEKYDGVRAIWNGNKLITRSNHEINAPSSFLSWFPKGIILDGELWNSRENFNSISGIVRRKKPEENNWKDMKFMAFDVILSQDTFNLPYYKRYAILQNIILKISDFNCPIILVNQIKINSREQLNEMLYNITKQGGEGLIIRDPLSLYEQKRSNKVLKVKPVKDNDAIIVGYEFGKGRLQHMMGKLIAEWVYPLPPVKIKVGGGFKDIERINYKKDFPIGSKIIVEYMSINPKTFQPRQPIFKGIRAD